MVIYEAHQTLHRSQGYMGCNHNMTTTVWQTLKLVWSLWTETVNCCQMGSVWSVFQTQIQTKTFSLSHSLSCRIYTNHHIAVYFDSIWFDFIPSDAIIRYLCPSSPSQVVQTGFSLENPWLCATGFRLSHLQAPVGKLCDANPPVSSNRGEQCQQQMFKTFHQMLLQYPHPSFASVLTYWNIFRLDQCLPNDK